MKKIVLLFLCYSVLVPIVIFGQTATVNFNNQHQKIDGFGGSSAWSGQLSSTVMQTLYQNGNNQLGFNILRCRIDPTMAWTDESVNAKNAKALGATVFATPWSPPASMKTNNNVVGGQLLTTSYAAYASYLNQFINYVGTNNIDIISLQNEPDFNPTYESCSWNASQFHDFCLNNAGSIIKPVMMPESFHYDTTLSDPTLNDAAAAKNISYIGGHLYGANPASYNKALKLGKPLWMTEWNATDYSATGLMVLGKQILDCMNQNFNAYVYWWMTEAGNGVISTTGVPNGYGYIMAQFAKYVRPGYYRVDATYNPQSGVYVVAFKGNGNYVIVTVNNSTSAKTQQFALQNGSVSTMTKYTTSISKNVANDGTVTVSNNSFTSTLDAQSVTTFVGVSNTTCATLAPTVTSPVTYCQGSTATALSATGTSLLWYTASTGGTGSATAPVPSTTAAGTTNYYVSQTANGCEGPRATIAVTVNALPVSPTVTGAVAYCLGSAATALSATGTALKWYTVATGGTGVTTAPIPNTATAGTTDYYVSQTITGCESPRAAIAVTVNALPVITPYVQLNGNWLQQNTATVCAGATISIGPQPVATTGWTWTGPSNYTSTARQITLTNLTTMQGGVYTSNYTDANGCKASSAFTVTVNALPNVPTVVSPITYCQNATATALSATGTNLNWYTIATGGTASTTAPTPNTATAGTTGYYVSQTTNGCEGARAAITVTVNVAPSAPIVNSPVLYCQNASSVDLSATGSSLLWYTTSTGGTGIPTAPAPNTSTAGTTNYYVSQTINSCESARAVLAVIINPLPGPVITSASNMPICTGTSAVLTTSTASSYSWSNGTSQVGTGQTYTATAAGSYTVTVNNGSGCSGASAAFVVSISTQNCYDCANVLNGTATIDNCGVCTGGTTGLTACTTTGTIGSIIGTSILVYPQPFENTTKVELKNGGNIESITIYSSTGALVYTNASINSNEVEIGENLADGLYNVIIQTQTGSYTTKIVKVK